MFYRRHKTETAWALIAHRIYLSVRESIQSDFLNVFDALSGNRILLMSFFSFVYAGTALIKAPTPVRDRFLYQIRFLPQGLG